MVDRCCPLPDGMLVALLVLRDFDCCSGCCCCCWLVEGYKTCFLPLTATGAVDDSFVVDDDMTLFPKNNTEKIAYENEQGENGRKENIFPRIRVSRSSRCEARGKIKKHEVREKEQRKRRNRKLRRLFLLRDMKIFLIVFMRKMSLFMRFCNIFCAYLGIWLND